LNTNENPFLATDSVKKAIQVAIEQNALQKYPPPQASDVRRSIAKYYDIDESSVLAANGSDEALSIALRTLLVTGDRVLIADPSYSLYPVLCQMNRFELVQVDLDSKWHVDFQAMLETARKVQAKLTVFVNPNAPTGIAEKKENIVKFAEQFQGIVLVDEAYGPFGTESLMQNAQNNIIVSSSFSKAYSLAGMRLGWIAADPVLIQQFDKVRDSYNLSLLAQVCAVAALEDKTENEKRIKEICERRDRISEDFRNYGFECLESSANFIFVSPPDRNANRYFQFLNDHKILVRYFASGRSSEFVRITIGTESQMNALMQATANYLAG
jgi:histidinol-phosphate aminotransferase